MRYHSTPCSTFANNLIKLLVGIGTFGCVTLVTLATWSCESREKTTRDTIKMHVKNRIDNGFSVGTVVVFLSEGKEEYFTYGFSDTTRSKPITRQAVFEMGSISKTFTSLLLADLVLQGKVKLDDPAERYLPDSVKVPTFNATRITLEQLATHTSGLPRMPDNFSPKDSTNPFADYGVDNLYQFLNSYHTTRAPGKYEYPNLGAGLLGHIICRVSGRDYEDLLQQKICKPFGLTQTSTLNTSPFLTTGHAGSTPVHHWDLSVLVGAGGIRSSGEDMLLYVKNQMGLISSPLLPAMKLTQRARHDADQKMKVGLGWHMAPIEGDTVIWHTGGTGGYRTFAGFSLKSKKAIIILNNSTKGDDGLGMYYFNQKTFVAPVKMPIEISPQHLGDKVGTYKIIKTGDIVQHASEILIRREGNHLLGRTNNSPWIKLFPESQNKFFTQQDHAIVFTRDSPAETQTIRVYYPGGFEIVAIKIK
jgi:D-alanyl-D-alanine-carboxypeptidase/D-alanyl-D-alanine-endopeptidase